MNLEQALQRAEKLASGLYSPDELHEFLSFMDSADPMQVNQVVEAYQEAIDNQPAHQLQVDPDFMSRLKALRPADSGDHRARIIPVRWIRWLAAAVLILLIAGAYLLNLSKKHTGEPPLADQPFINSTGPKNDLPPGGNKAVLTLSGGRQIILDSAEQGDLTIQGNARVSQTGNGKLVYKSVGNASGAVTTYNTLTTPRGGQYQLKLPDGTQVWLNAASSITYPTAFAGRERKVRITGEAYFEVAKNADWPFFVEENDLVIKVLGTRFDVNGYDNEPIRKTLLVEGSVNIVYQKTESHLEPGMQAQVQRAPGGDQRKPVLTIIPGNIEQTLAWKNGFFAFANADLPTVMRQLARWYDVDVNYEGVIPKDAFEFNGKIGRTLTLEQVLKLLTQTHVHYTIRGKQLTIRP